MRSCAFVLMLAVFLLPVTVLAQKDTVDVASDFGVGEGSLNDAIQAKIDAGTLSNTVFRLEPYGLYILTGAIVVPAGQTLEIMAAAPGNTQETAPPMLCWTPSGDVDRQFYFNAFGDLYMKNIWLLYADTNTEDLGTQVGTEISISEDTTDNKNVAVFDNVIFDYCNIGAGGGAVTVAATHANLTFTNCYFRNFTDTHFRYYGRPVSYRFNTQGYHIDKVLFENCTFANTGYVFMQEGGEYADTVQFNHCTFLNSMMFTLQTGWWNWLSVTNSVFVNAFMFGHFGDMESIPAGGALNIDSVSTFGFGVPFTDPQRHILFANNSYFIEDWLRQYMAPYDAVTNPTGGNPYSNEWATLKPDTLPQPMPMMSEKTKAFFDDKAAFPYMTMQDVYDSVNPGFLVPPTNIVGIKAYLLRKWTDNSDTTWAYNPNADVNQVWPMNEQLRYSNTTLRTAGMGGFPLGDIYRWWSNQPTQYQNWLAQRDAENQAIWELLTDGPVSVEDVPSFIPLAFELGQNYPNPFNPSTQIDYALPIRGRVSLKVYNLLGMEVATLVDKEQEAGTHGVTFDAKNLASGIYFYRLNVTPDAGRNGSSGVISITKKLVLMK